MSSPKLPESISNGTFYPELPILENQEPELGGQFRVKVRYPWLQTTTLGDSFGS